MYIEDTAGTRIHPEAGELPCEVERRLPLGGYAYLPDYRTWVFRAPNGDVGSISPDTTHRVQEHEDGSITVQPSLHFATGKRWHGWLQRGKWVSC